MNIALVQFSRNRFDVEINQNHAIELLSSINNVDIVCMPEVWMGATLLDNEQENGLLESLCHIAKKNEFTLFTGGLFVKRGDIVHDICHVISEEGKVIGEQLKIFPSGAVGEREYCKGGSELNIFEVNSLKIGIAVCVDIFYPELVRFFAMNSVSLLLNPANIPQPRQELWHAIVRTRSSENTIFTAYTNNTDTSYMDGRPVMGNSLVTGPDGSTIARGGESEEIIRFSIDRAMIEEQRKRWSYLDDIKDLNIQDGKLS